MVRLPFSVGALPAVWASIVWSSMGGAAADAAEGTRLRVVVWGAPQDQREFVTRLRGQTVDLPVDLIEADAGPPNPPLERQVNTAQKLSRTNAARAVVWRDADQVYLFLASPLPAHLLTRPIGTGGGGDRRAAPSGDPGARRDGGGSGSASLESAALIIRTALRAVLQGTTVGEPHVPAPDGPSATASAPPLPSPPSDGTVTFLFLAGWRTTWDGITDSAAQGIDLHAGVGWRRLTLGATGMATFDRDAGTAGPQPFWRQNLALFLDVDIVSGSRARLTGELQGGVAIYNLYRPAGTVTRRYLLSGAEVRGAFDLLGSGPVRLWLWLAVGADFIPNAPPIVRDPSDRIIWDGRPFQPRVMLGTGVGF